LLELFLCSICHVHITIICFNSIFSDRWWALGEKNSSVFSFLSPILGNCWRSVYLW
jgi:hypothetical protein